MKKKVCHCGVRRDEKEEEEKRRLEEIILARNSHDRVAICEIDDTWEELAPDIHRRKRSRPSDDPFSEEEE